MKTYSSQAKSSKERPKAEGRQKLIGFRFLGIDWSLEPKTLFYDKQIESVGQLKFEGFPETSKNRKKIR
jgi:hypothetical protein